MINSLKELKFLSKEFTDFSNVLMLEINPLLIKFLPQTQKNNWYFHKMISVNHKLILQYVYSKFNYTNKNTKAEIICPVEGHGPFWQLPFDHLKHQGCPLCSTNQKRNLKWFVDKSILVHGNNYGYSLSNYIDSYTKIKIGCLKCNNFFWQLPSDHTGGHGCPICNFSKGEIQISKIIRNNRIKFETQWHFNKHKNLKRGVSAYLAFDFYLPEYNLCIEYDGEQHFKIINNRRYKISQEDLIYTQYKDNLKNQFCLDHDIRLVRIPYWVKPTEELILQLLEEKFTVKMVLK